MLGCNIVDAQPGGEPGAAKAVGYNTLVFFDDFTSSSTIDMNATGYPGFNWYPQSIFSPGPPTPPANMTVSDGVLTLQGALSMAVNHPGTGVGLEPYFYGNAFGGGAYFEARIQFDPSLGAFKSYWPSWWSEALEHVIDVYNGYSADNWPGQPQGYVHFSELDFFDAINLQLPYTNFTYYATTIHDWPGPFVSGEFEYNIYNGYGGNQFYVPHTGSTVGWGSWHVYGCLWVPQKGSSPGYVQWYFDNMPGPIIYWAGPPGAPPLPDPNTGIQNSNTPLNANVTYSIIDSQHLLPILSTDPSWPMQIDWVKVWCASSACLLTSARSAGGSPITRVVRD